MKLVSITATSILLPITIGFTINRLAEDSSLPSQEVIQYLATIFILFFVGVVAEYIWNRTCAFYLSHARHDLEQFVFKKLLVKSYRFHALQSGAAVVSQANRFIQSFQYFHDVVFRDLLTIIVTFSMTLVISFAFSWRIAVVILVWAIAYTFIVAYAARKKFAQKQLSAAAGTKMTSYFTDVMSNMVTVKTFAREADEQRRYSAYSSKKMITGQQSWTWSAAVSALIGSMMAILNISVLSISFYRIQIGAMDIGTLILIQVFVVRLSLQLWQLGSIIRDIDKSFSDSGEMTQILIHEPEFTDPSGTHHKAITKGHISFSNVHFRYPDADNNHAIFKDLSLEIRAGEKVGIVGPSGSGKTTLARALLRLASISHGTITIDGHDINTIARSDIRNAIAYVPQEPILFNRSLLDNIRYGKPSASMEEVELAVKKARADVFIERLPDGYKTMIGERGFKLSRGQRQRIAIARAMLKQSPILILDEATSALDSASEKLIQKALDELTTNRTTIVIAHRLSTVQKLDTIVVLQGGKIVEKGSHEELVNKQGVYTNLWK